MITKYSLYDEDGKIISSGFGEMDNFDCNGFFIIEDYFDPNEYYIDVKECVAIKIPEKPSYDHVFDYKTKTWVYSVSKEEKEEIFKEIRNNLLLNSDWTQLPNNPLTIEKQQEWAVYRQALRDITKQYDYPFNIVWPTPPQG
jgi:hypothetical protein